MLCGCCQYSTRLLKWTRGGVRCGLAIVPWTGNFLKRNCIDTLIFSFIHGCFKQKSILLIVPTVVISWLLPWIEQKTRGKCTISLIFNCGVGDFNISYLANALRFTNVNMVAMVPQQNTKGTTKTARSWAYFAMIQHVLDMIPSCGGLSVYLPFDKYLTLLMSSTGGSY